MISLSFFFGEIYDISFNVITAYLHCFEFAGPFVPCSARYCQIHLHFLKFHKSTSQFMLHSDQWKIDKTRMVGSASATTKIIE